MKNDVFINVRSAYRLLHDYQCMVRDAVRYISGQLDIQENAGWSRFAGDAEKGGYRYLRQPSWDWLPMMSYEFHFQTLGDERLSLSFFIISDTGFINGDENVNDKSNLSAYVPANQSSSVFAFILRKNPGWDQFPFMQDKGQMKNFIKLGGSLPDDLLKEGFVGKCYDMICLSSESEANKIVADVLRFAEDKKWPLKRKNALQGAEPGPATPS